MRGKNIGRKWLAIVWLCGFLIGVILGREGMPEMVFAEEQRLEVQERLPFVIYNDKGRKVCVKEGTKLPLSEELRIEIPLWNWEVGREALVEVQVTDDDGNSLFNHVRIKRILLHNDEK